MTLTLQTIWDQKPCEEGWKKLRKSVGNGMTRELSIGDVLISNGLDDALWCLQCLPPRQRVAAIMPAVKRVSTCTKGRHVRDCIADIDRWLDGDDTVDLVATEYAIRAAVEQADTRLERLVHAVIRAAVYSTRAPRAARTAAWRAGTAAWAADAAEQAERKLQEADLLEIFPPIILKRANQ